VWCRVPAVLQCPKADGVAYPKVVIYNDHIIEKGVPPTFPTKPPLRNNM